MVPSGPAPVPVVEDLLSFPGLRAVCSSREAIERDDSPRGECGQGCCRWRDDLDLLPQAHQGDVGECDHQMQKRSWTSSSQKRGVCWDPPVRSFKNCQLHFPCVYSRESAAAMTCTQTKPDSMLPRYYVASCTVNLE